METERKYQKGLNRAHWMCRIQKWAFGIDAPSFYVGYCPFFWMTWLALLAAPFVLSGKILGFLYSKLETWCSSHLDEWEKKREERPKVPKPPKPKRKATPKKPHDKFFKDVWNWIYNYGVKPEEAMSYGLEWHCKPDTPRLRAWFMENPDWLQEMEAAKARLDKLAEETRARETRRQDQEKARKESWNRIACRASTFGRMIARVIVFALIPLTCWGIFLLGQWLGENWWTALKWAGMFLLTTTIIFSLGLALTKLEKWLTNADWSGERAEAIGEKLNTWSNTTGRFFTWIGHGIHWCGKTITDILTFLGTTVKLTYKAECPMIIWGNETTPITPKTNEIEPSQGRERSQETP